MRIVIQKVSRARVSVDGNVVSSIGDGLLVFVGLTHGDSAVTFDPIIQKVLKLRIFPDKEGKMNKSLVDVGGEILSVSQFTLYADCRKGNRPSFYDAMPQEQARPLYGQFVERVKALYESDKVKDGIFGAYMEVELINDGPVTILQEL